MSMHKSFAHDSAAKHVSGSAEYIDDIPMPAGGLHAYLGLSERPHAKLVSMTFDKVLAAPGVVTVLTAKDVPGVNDVSSNGSGDEPLLAVDEVLFWGQPLFAVIAETREQARRAAALAEVTYEDLPAHIDILSAMEAGGDLVTKNLILQRGDAAAELDGSQHRLSARMVIGGQEHFYLESQVSLAIPGEDEEVTIFASTQHPSEIQHIVSHVLGVPSNAVTVTVRRMGGGFGGKETQGNLFAAIAAMAAKKLGCAIKIRPDRDDDMSITGKRHDFVVDYELGFDENGKILAVDGKFMARAGWSSDLSGPVTDRALFHADNAYYYPAVRLESFPLRTHTVSNTAFRGFGGPQGLIAAERFVEEVAYALGMDPLDVRKANFYGTDKDNVTPYHQTIVDNILHPLVDELEAKSDYRARRAEIIAFNQTSRIIKRGIALTPVKFGISFTATWYNQAGALVHVYRDGSVHLNHGGTEMGQGLNMKVAQVVADAFGLPVSKVRITATHTGKVPNTSATAASSGSDLNGMAAADACRQIKERLSAFAAEEFQSNAGDVSFADGQVFVSGKTMSFKTLIDKAYMARVQLSAAGFYKTPEIHWDRASGRGNPFYYFAYGASVSEVSVDILTGEYTVERADILHDVGRSLNPAIDLGQVEGGFIQGMGWLTTEELVWNDKGRLTTHAPSTYKIPVASDVPKVFNTWLADWSVNPKPTIGRSKAVGEPPLMLPVSVVEALSMAVASLDDYRTCPRLDTPVTPERVLMAAERIAGAKAQ